MYGTTTQIGNAAGVAVIGAVFFAIEAALSARLALFSRSSLVSYFWRRCGVHLREVKYD